MSVSGGIELGAEVTRNKTVTINLTYRHRSTLRHIARNPKKIKIVSLFLKSLCARWTSEITATFPALEDRTFCLKLPPPPKKNRPAY